MAREFWINGSEEGGWRRIEIYASTTNPGNRNSLAKRRHCYNLRPSGLGYNEFSSKADARAFLISKGFRKE